MHRTIFGITAAIAAAGTVALVAPAPAEACGGFFCNRQPIDQSGENIIYAAGDDGTMETHVQILYQGTAESFAWILPVPSVPELGVGTDVFFQQIRQATQPQFRTNSETTGECRTTPECPRDDDGWWGREDYDTAGPMASADAGAAPPSGEVEVLLEESVGPYDAVVLSSTDAMALFDWLTDNSYDIPEASVPLLMEYIENGNYFLALKLQQNRGTGEIQPVVLRYTELKPCLPIKLTSIATVPDMPITAYILGSRRARPNNYLATEPDLDDSSFWLRGASYADAVSRAVDDAGGQAFVTDFAGATPTMRIALADVEDLRETSDPGAFLMGLQERGFNGDSQLLGLLLRYIPPPTDAESNQFYNCIVNSWCDTYDAHLAGLSFDPGAFVDALNEAIVEPRQHAEDLTRLHPQLTRLFTTMSAEDMTLDPLFDLDEAVPEVSNIHEAMRLTECAAEYFSFHAPVKFILPSGAEEVLQEGIAYMGSDDQYCEDREGGMYGPYVEDSTARATATRRGIVLGGGGGCNVSGSAGGLGLGLFLGLGILVGSRRRRR